MMKVNKFTFSAINVKLAFPQKVYLFAKESNTAQILGVNILIDVLIHGFVKKISNSLKCLSKLFKNAKNIKSLLQQAL